MLYWARQGGKREARPPRARAPRWRAHSDALGLEVGGVHPRDVVDVDAHKPEGLEGRKMVHSLLSPAAHL